MAIGLAGKSVTWQPLATTIAAGLAFATFICLLVIPCLQSILDDAGGLFGRALSKLGSSQEEGLEPRPTGVPSPAAGRVELGNVGGGAG